MSKRMRNLAVVAELLYLCDDGRIYWRPGKRPKTINYLLKMGVISRVRKNLYFIDCEKLLDFVRSLE